MRSTDNSGQRAFRRLVGSAALLGLLLVIALPSGSALAAPHRDKFNTDVLGVSPQHLIPAAGKREVISFGTSANLTQLHIAGACDACPGDDAIAVTVGI